MESPIRKTRSKAETVKRVVDFAGSESTTVIQENNEADVTQDKFGSYLFVRLGEGGKISYIFLELV